MKNPMGKSRTVDDPYLTVESRGWTWKVLKAYSSDPNKPGARWFCAVQSPLMQGGTEARLHGREFPLGGADFIAARTFGHGHRGIIGILQKRNHGAGNAPHRHHHQQIEAEIDENRSEQRNRHRQRHDPLSITEHKRTQRRFVQYHFNDDVVFLS